MRSITLPGGMLALALLAGCYGPDIGRIRGTTGTSAGTRFTQALTEEYRSIALFEADRMLDWPDAEYFAGKALAAARGDTVLPEDPARWSLSAGKRQELTAARGRLLEALDGTARTRVPVLAAKAQAKFDCWVEQEEEGWQVQDISSCRAGFLALLAQLQPPPVAAPAAAPLPAPAPITAQEFVLYFDWDSAQLTADALRLIDRAATVARTQGEARITLVGHADRSGPEQYNLRLSLRRADAVRSALLRAGIGSERMSVTALGETEPAIPTADGVREPRNRRVQITIR